MSSSHKRATNPDNKSTTKLTDQSSSSSSSSTVNPVVLELVYEKLMSSISVDVACQMHRLMKTGVYPSSELLVPKSRDEVYPKIYHSTRKKKRKKTPHKEERKYSVFVPQQPQRKRLGEKDNNDPIEAYLRGSTTAIANSNDNQPTTAPDETTSQHPTAAAVARGSIPHRPPSSQQHLDIWGKAPPKEPKQMVACLICGRQVNALRFAPHLDKCMGIGTTVRAAALAASGFVPQQLSAHSAASASAVTSTTTTNTSNSSAATAARPAAAGSSSSAGANSKP